MFDNRYISALRSNLEEKSIRTLLILSGISILLAFMPRLMLIGLLLSIGLWAFYFSPLRTMQSIFLKLIVSFLLITCLQQVIGLLFWMLELRLTLPWLISLQAITLILFCLTNKNQTLPQSPFVSRTDIAAILVGLIGPALLFFSILSGGNIAQQLLRFFSTGFDNTAHLSLTLSNYDNQGLVYGEKDTVTDKVVYAGFNVYPQGWHLNNAMIMRSVFPDGLSVQEDLTRIMASYFTLIMVWFFIIMYLFFHTCAALARTISRKEHEFFELFIIALFSLFIQSLTITSFIRLGFGNFLPQIAYLLLLILTGVRFYSERDKKKQNLPSYILLGLLLCSGMALSWMLTAAIGYSIVFLTAYSTYGKSLWKFILYLFQPKILIPSLLLLFAPVVQIVLWLLYGGVNDHLNATGGIEPLNRTTLLVFIISASLIYLFGKFKELNHLFMSTLVGALALSGLVYAHQMYSTENESYYSIKLAHLCLILIAVFIGGALACYSRNLKRERILLSSLFALSLLLFIPQVVEANISSWGYLRGNFLSLSEYSSSQILNILDSKKDTRPNVIVYKELDYEEDVVSTNFIKMLSRTNTSCQSSIFNSIIVRDQESLLAQITECVEKDNMQFHIIASEQNFDELSAYFRSLNPRVEIILSN